MKFSNSLKCMITNYHVISEDSINKNIELEIYNQKIIILILKNRFIHYFEKPKDITVIEIKEFDDIFPDIEFLDYDSNFILNGYKIYTNEDIFTIQHPLGNSAACASGIIVDINNFEFFHNIPTQEGSSGCPIILLKNNINFIQVIGIHKNSFFQSKNVNGGIFLGEIINQISNDLYLKYLNKKKDEDNNYIIAEINIE